VDFVSGKFDSHVNSKWIQQQATCFGPVLHLASFPFYGNCTYPGDRFTQITYYSTYLTYRFSLLLQYTKKRDTPQLPEDFKEIIDDDAYKKSRLYSLDKERFDIVSSIWSAFENSVRFTQSAYIFNNIIFHTNMLYICIGGTIVQFTGHFLGY